MEENKHLSDAEQSESPDDIKQPSPLLQVFLYGLGVIIIAAIAMLIVRCVNYPGSVSTLKDFFGAALDSFVFVLNFDFKVWWVFLLILYLVARFYKRS